MPFFVTEPLTAEKAQKIEGIVRVKTWERGLFFQQRSAWRVVALLCVLLLAGFGFSRVKTKNRSIISNGNSTHYLNYTLEAVAIYRRL